MSGRLAADDPRHGSANGYGNLDCRCDACREAWRVKMEQRRRARGQQTLAEYVARVTRHGLSRYRKGCRCAVCRRASADHRKAARDRAKERASG